MKRRDYFDWHSWTGLTTGLLLFVVCWSGAIAVFSYEIDWLLDPDQRASTLKGEPDWIGWRAAAEAAYPHHDVSWMETPRYDGFAALVVMRDADDALKRVYVDPVENTVQGDTTYFNVQRFFRSFHMMFFYGRNYFDILGVPLGYFIVAILSLPLLISTITSLIFYKRWQRGFFKLETKKGAKVFWSDAHKLTGVWSLWIAAVIGVTGFWYLAERWIPPGDSVLRPVVPVEAEQPPTLADAIAMTNREFPELDVRSVSLPIPGRPLFFISGHDGGFLTRGRAGVMIDSRTGAVVEIRRSDLLGPADYLKEIVDPIHFGTFGGIWTQGLYFLFGLALSSLALTGAYIHAQRQARRKGSKAIRKPVLAAYGITVLVLALACREGWRTIKAYGAGGAWPEVGWPVILFIAAWCASTFAALTIWMVKLR